MRLNPFNRPYEHPMENDRKVLFNYLLDKQVEPVSIKMLTEGVYDPWKETDESDFDVVVPERN